MSISSINGADQTYAQWNSSLTLNSANDSSNGTVGAGDQTTPPGGGFLEVIIAALQAAGVGSSTSAPVESLVEEELLAKGALESLRTCVAKLFRHCTNVDRNQHLKPPARISSARCID
jgi:hypothetical protein